MSFAPLSYLSQQYEGFENYWLKCYLQGTTTPITMYDDAAGTTSFAKLEINIDGFFESSGGAIIIPHVGEVYDAWLFPTEAEADANDTSNATQIADNISASDELLLSAKLNPETLSDLTNSSEFTANDVGVSVPTTKERTTGNGGGGTYDVALTSSVTPNTFNIVVGVSDPSISFVLREGDIIDAAQYGVATGATDAVNFAAGQAAIDRGRSVKFPSTFNIDDEFIPATSNTVLYFNGGIIRQNTIDKAVIKATGLDNFFIVANKQVFFGEGSWSAGWTGNSGHNDRVIRFITCTNSGIVDPVIKNGANAGLSVEGCKSFFGVDVRAEGTHTHGVPLSALDNFQNALYIKHSPTDGDCEDINITFDVSGSAQGVLVEGYADYDGDFGGNLIGIAHDIPGQHGMYCQSGNVNIDIVARDCNLDGCKIQVNAANYKLKNVNATVNALRCLSHGLEVQDAIGSGSLSNVIASVVSNECQRGFGANVNIENSSFNVVATNSSQYGAIVQGAGMKDNDLTLISENSGRNGLLVTGLTGSKNITIKAKIREANNIVGAHSGSDAAAILTDDTKAFNVNEFVGNTLKNLTDGSTTTVTANTETTITGVLSGGTNNDWDEGDDYALQTANYDGVNLASGDEVTLIDLEATDSNSFQRYGLFNVAMTGAKVQGSAKLTGASTLSGRADVALLEWPSDVTLDGTTQEQLTAGNFGLSQHINRVTAQSTSTTQITLWQIPLEDESAYSVTATIVGKLAGSSERAVQMTTVLFYRDGAGTATKEGADTDIVDRESASFGGVIIWEGSGNNARIRVHSGSAVTYDWSASVIVTKIVD